MAKKPFFTIDAETDPFEYGVVPEPFVWGLYDGQNRKYIKFYNTERLIDFIKSNKGIYFAHNGGKFDFHYLKKAINTHEKILMINGRLVQAKIGQSEIRDSYALLPFPLKMIGNKLDIEYWKLHKKHRDKHMSEIEEYLRADCVELWGAINEFFETYGRHLTAPGAAIKQLMKMGGLKIENSGSGFFNSLHKYYYGGRCQAFKPGIYKGLRYYDINSAYPFAMTFPHPIGTEYAVKYSEKPEIIPQNFYTIEAENYGAFPLRTKKGLTFDFKGKNDIYHVTGWELIAGLENNMCIIKRHIKQIEFEQFADFSNFVNYFWNLRKSTEKGSRDNLFCKLMLNASYGKFASNPQQYDTFVLYPPGLEEFLTKNEWKLHGEIGENTLASTPMNPDDMRFYNVATAASITGFVRSMLIRAISDVQGFVYCDTDSVIFEGEHALEIGGDLGQWSSEGDFAECAIAGKKMYALYDTKGNEKVSCKGVRLTASQIFEIARGKEITYKQEAPVFSWKKDISFLKRKIKINC